jgi:hypothetical protein
MKTFKIFYEQSEIESLEALIANPDPKKVKEYGGNAYVDMLKKKLEKAKESRPKEDEENGEDYIGKTVVYATRDTAGGGPTSFTRKSKVVKHDEKFNVLTLADGTKVNTVVHQRKDKNLYTTRDFYIDSSVSEEDAQDRCKRKADSVYGKKTSAYKSGAIVRCRKGKIWKKK